MSIMIVAALLAGAPASADTVLGRWKTETHNAIVEISRCGASICGKVVTSDAIRANPAMKDSKNANAALRNRPVQGMLMLNGFKHDGAGVWSSGQVYNAEDGKTYSGQTWTRAR
jgi:uncharacterized protein (DUF2147 family)